MRGIWRLVRRRPLAAGSLFALIALYGMMLFAEFIAPYSHTKVFRDYSYYPPNVSLYSEDLGVGPQVQERALVDQLNWKYVRIQGRHHRIRLLPPGDPYRLWGIIPLKRHLFGTAADSDEPVFLLGADHLGRDLFSRIVYGSRISLNIGFIAIAISFFLAVILGGLAGYFGGGVDWSIMRVAEFLSLIPGIYLILFLRSILTRDLDSGQSFIIITAILSLVGWPGSARLIRGLIHSIKREDYITAARLQQVPTMRIIFRHILPQLSSIIIVSVTLGIPGFILTETALSYLGLGIVDPAVSWGSLINRDITSLSNLRSFTWFLYPGVFLLITTMAFSFLGDALRDKLDPHWYQKGE